MFIQISHYLKSKTFLFLLATCISGIIASLIQTQVNLAEIISLGAPVSFQDRLSATFEDLGRFGPVMFGLSAAGMLLALLTEQIIKIFSPALNSCVIAGICGWFGLWATFLLLGLVTPMDSLVSATRDLSTLFMVCCSGAVGAIIYNKAKDTSLGGVPHKKTTQKTLLTAAILLAFTPIISFVTTKPPKVEQPATILPSAYTIQVIAEKLHRPWSVAFLPDGRPLVTLMSGKLLAFDSNNTSSEIDTSELPEVYNAGRVSGMMEILIDPDFQQNNYVYITMAYGDSKANGTNLVRARLQNNKLDNVQIIFSSTPKSGSGNNGGRMTFLPDDTIALTVGDGGGRREEAQNTNSHLGKVVRVDRNGNIPSDNPFVGTPETRPEIYSVGHRNAQGIAYDQSSNTLLLTEHGPRGGDEINEIVSGGNYGWPLVTHGIDYSFARVTPLNTLDNFVDPLLHWTPSIAPSGLAIYSGDHFPDWEGYLLVPALKERAIRLIERNNGKITGQKLLLSERGARIRDVKVANDGSIYVIEDGEEGRLLKLVSP